MKDIGISCSEKARDSLQGYLAKIAFISNPQWKKEFRLANLEADWLVTMKIVDISRQLLMEVKNSGQPAWRQRSSTTGSWSSSPVIGQKLRRTLTSKQ